jgi:hypothetical protein
MKGKQDARFIADVADLVAVDTHVRTHAHTRTRDLYAWGNVRNVCKVCNRAPKRQLARGFMVPFGRNAISESRRNQRGGRHSFFRLSEFLRGPCMKHTEPEKASLPGLMRARPPGSCVTVAGGTAARRNHPDRSRKNERTEDVEARCAAMGSRGEMVGSRAVEANKTGRPRICPHEARDRGQVPVISHDRTVARCPQTGASRRRIRGTGDGGVLIPWLPTTSPTRPPVAASFSGRSVLWIGGRVRLWAALGV